MHDPREWLQQHVQARAAQPALTDPQGEWSYARLNEMVLRIADALNGAGLQPSARVVFAARKSSVGVALALACFRQGLCFVPIDPEAPADRHRLMLSAAKPAMLVTDRVALARLAQEAGIPLREVQDLAGAPAPEPAHASPPVPFDPERPAYMMFTSGSSGVPKAVTIPWRALATFYTAITEYYPVKAGSRCLNTAPAYFDVSVLDTWFPLFCGAHVRITDPSELFPPRFLAILAGERIQFMCCVAPQLKLVAECGSLMNHFDLSSLDTVMTGAESPDPEAMQRWIHSVPHLRLLNGYGPTEATCVCTVYVIDRSNVAGPLPYPMGRALAGTSCALSAEGRLLEGPEQEGELWVAGPQLMQGYFGDAERTREKLITENGQLFYKTGDRVRRLGSGDFIYLGRVDEEVKVAGYRIDLSEVTSVANRHPQVRESFAAAVLDRGSGYRQIGLVVRLDSDDAEAVIPAVRERLEHTLPKYMLPRRILAMRRFPRLGSGKLDKRALTETLDRETNAA